MKTKYFTGIKTADELKQAYRSFCLRMHPDCGGDADEFKAMKSEYEYLLVTVDCGVPLSDIGDESRIIGNTKVTVGKLIARLVEVFLDDDMRSEYLSGGHTSVSYGWDGSALTPESRDAYISKFGAVVVEKCEQAARQRLQQMNEAYSKSHYAAYIREAEEHEAQGSKAPAEGAFVFGVHSGMKDCNGICDELYSYVRHPEWFDGSAEDDSAVSDSVEVERRNSKREPLYKVLQVFEVSAEEFTDSSTATRLVKEARERGDEFPGGFRTDDPDLKYPNDEYRYWYGGTAAVVCKDDGRWYLIDSEGHNYARYIILPRNFREMYSTEIAEARAEWQAEQEKQARIEAEERAARFADYLERCKKYEGKMEDIRPLYDAVGEARRMENEASKAHGYRSAEYKAAGKVSRAKEAALTAAQKRNVIAMATTMFPGLKCKATKSHRYCSGYDLTYIDGPKMDDFLQRTDYELFSEYWEEYRMDDCTEYHREEFTDFAEKYAASGHYGVDVKREWSDETKQRLTAAVLKAVPACEGCCWENRYQWTEDDLKLVAEEVSIGYADLSFAYERKKTFFNFIDAETIAEWCFEMMDFYGDTNQTPNFNDNPNDNQNQKEETTMATKKSTKNESANVVVNNPAAQAQAAEQPATSQYSIAPYTNKQGETGYFLFGFTSQEEAKGLADRMAKSVREGFRYENHVRYDVVGFPPRYAQMAQQMCDALNAGDAAAVAKIAASTFDVYAAAVADGKAESDRKRAERKEAEAKAKAKEVAKVKKSAGLYSKEDVANLLADVLAGKEVPEDIKKLLAA